MSFFTIFSRITPQNISKIKPLNNACVLQVHVAEDRGQDLMYSQISEDGSKLLYIGTIGVGIKIRHIFYVFFFNISSFYSIICFQF